MPPRLQPALWHGALVIDKPRGKTSHDVVDVVRRLAGFRQVGHLGTLDPLATGVLVLLLGRATRLAQFYSGRRKRYTAAIRFGFATDTYDADGQPQGADVAPVLDSAQIERLAAERVGRFAQMPPPFSAKKIRGQPAHRLARKNKSLELKPAEVEVYEYRITQIDGPLARCVIECSSGTYIRALAHEMGERVGSGAHLAEIARTAVGEFTLDQAVGLPEFEAAASAGKLRDRVIPIEQLLPDFARVNVLPAVEQRVRHGTRFTVVNSQIQPGDRQTAQGATAELDSAGSNPAPLVRVFNHQDRLIAIAQAVVPRTYQPIVVLDAGS
jgi:tRNA pseudouridine55 synthase